MQWMMQTRPIIVVWQDNRRLIGPSLIQEKYFYFFFYFPPLFQESSQLIKTQSIGVASRIS